MEIKMFLGVTKVWPNNNWGVIVTLKGRNLRVKKYDKTCCVHNIIQIHKNVI